MRDKSFANRKGHTNFWVVTWAMGLTPLAWALSEPSFEEFDRRAAAGETLTVVFFGASLTWGANATDPALTSYRARMQQRLEAAYPRARFRCYDAAIGGTGSPLAAFRLDRDVLGRKPDLVFLDFSANDNNQHGSETGFAAYEAILRRLLTEARAVVVTVLFPFRWEVKPAILSGRTDHLKGLHHRAEIAAAYDVPSANAAAYIADRIRAGVTTLDQVWDLDGVHPGDLGYRLFAEAAWNALEEAVRQHRVCRPPPAMLHADTFLTVHRARLAELFGPEGLPRGWRIDRPHRTAACHDQVMSRWLDSLAVASNRLRRNAPDGKEAVEPVTPEPLRLTVRGRFLLIFGEATTQSGAFRVRLDGQVVEGAAKGQPAGPRLFDMNARRFGANWSYHAVIAEQLEETVEHQVAIEPQMTATDDEQELRIESLCVAGPGAWVGRPSAEESPSAKGREHP